MHIVPCRSMRRERENKEQRKGWRIQRGALEIMKSILGTFLPSMGLITPSLPYSTKSRGNFYISHKL